jgi:hypothetical protein
MRAVLASLVATGSLLALLASTAAAPPGDVAAHCRATYPQAHLQIRCLNAEHAAAARVSRASVGVDPDAFNRCLGSTTSWVTMEACLGQAARVAEPGATTASTPAPGPDADGRTALAPTPGSDDAPAPATGTVGPQPGVPSAAPVHRPSLSIPEADADRQLRAVLERTGVSATQCRKKQYGPGWVTICEDPRAVEHRRPLAPPPAVIPPPTGDTSPALPGLEDGLGP